LNQWPYRCEECGSNFLLKKRYLRPKKEKEVLEVKSPRFSDRPTLTAPIGGVAAGDAVRKREQRMEEELGEG
jgi:hypothetical protein